MKLTNKGVKTLRQDFVQVVDGKEYLIGKACTLSILRCYVELAWNTEKELVELLKSGIEIKTNNEGDGASYLYREYLK